MRNVFLLLKKDFLENRKFRKSHRRDFFASISTLCLFALIYSAFVYVFYHFAQTYLSTDFGEPSQSFNRGYELMVSVLAFSLIITAVVGAKKIYSALVESKDVNVLLYQPVSANELFAYKLIKVYKATFVTNFIILLPTGIIIDLLLGQYGGGAGYYVALIAMCVLVPIVGCALASLIAVPFNSIMRFIETRFVLHLLIYIIIIGIGFYLYSLFLNMLNDLLRTGGLKYVFELNIINLISRICSNAYPVNFFVDMLFGIKPWISLLVIFGIVILSGTVSSAIIHRIYLKIIQQKMEGADARYISKLRFKKLHSPVGTLLLKEYLVILRTPSYAFQYFATTLSLPMMVYVCVSLLRSMMSKLPAVYMINCDYEISLFVISMFAVLTNTFCTSNISRDGHMLGMLKTLPVSGKTVILSKLLFCSVVGVISVLTSSVTLLIGGFIKWWQAIVIFVLASGLTFAEVAVATRRDLNKPTMPSELENDNSTIASGMLYIALIVSLVLGAGVVALSVVLTLEFSAGVALGVSLGFSFAIVCIVIAFACAYLFRGLEKSYNEAGGGGQ